MGRGIVVQSPTHPPFFERGSGNTKFDENFDRIGADRADDRVLLACFSVLACLQELAQRGQRLGSDRQGHSRLQYLAQSAAEEAQEKFRTFAPTQRLEDGLKHVVQLARILVIGIRIRHPGPPRFDGFQNLLDVEHLLAVLPQVLLLGGLLPLRLQVILVDLKQSHNK